MENEEINPEDIGPADFVEVEKVDDGDILEKPIDVSEIDKAEFFGEKTPSEFVNVKEDKKELLRTIFKIEFLCFKF